MGKFAKQRVADGAAPAKPGQKVKNGCAPTAKAKGILKTSPSTRDHGIEIGNALDKLMAQNYFSSKEEEQKAKETARGQVFETLSRQSRHARDSKYQCFKKQIASPSSKLSKQLKDEIGRAHV